MAMADLSHLEKMGRELKCPICLSLLKSAVSLVCNHVFCNLCITESMKSVSDCPVCKVPFRRREIRPAPHMDNLVTCFKSMEVAAGVNIFSTQVGPSTKNPGDVENNSGAKDTALTQQGWSKKKGSINKTRQKLEKTDVKTSDLHRPAKPSFPAKKRVHVTPYPVSETPVRPVKDSKPATTGSELETSKVLNEEKRIAADGQGDTLFSPFFWLREENDDEDDEASWKPSGQPTADTSQSNTVPCFSDIKDSEDDKSPIKVTSTVCPQKKMTATSQFNAAEVFDSEMFEWTQRACSPELCSTPVRKQTSGRHKLDAIQEKDCLEQTGAMLNNEVPHEEAATSLKNGQTSFKDQSNIILAKKGRLTEKKRPARTRGKHLKKCSNKAHDSSLDEVHPEVLVDSREMVKESSQEDEDDEKKELTSHGGRTVSKRVKKAMNKDEKKNNAAIADASMQAPSISMKQKIQKQEADVIGKMLPDLTISTTKNDLELNVQNETRKRGKQATSQVKKKHMKLSMDNAMSNIIDEVSFETVAEAKTQNQECQYTVTNIQVFSSEHVSGNGSPRSVPEIEKVVEESKEQRKRKIRTVGVDNKKNKICIASPETDGHKSNQSDSFAARKLSSSKQVPPTSGDTILRNCANLHSQIICAFCQSSNDTEDSGEMMHYYNGKPVAADYNGGVNVIHSHKHCTEWAPDVYFEDDSAINLAAELARSRRIKCSCCGVKGAALGCYEKSCRKSFHFTCAKLISECRWDKDNFVMLCPLHASSKLPSEASEHPKQRRKRPSPKGELKTPNINGQDKSQCWTWLSGSPCKWVLCCSALTASEKDIISEFTRLTGVPISKSWSPAVTHVIASTDENGACRRTLKFLMGILDGKWILSIEWIKACLKAMEPVEEENFEITIDVHGSSGGPQLGRLRAIYKESKLFDNFRFYLTGDFTPPYKGYLQDLVTAAGGTVLQRKPLTKDQEKLFHNSSMLETFIIYSLESPEKQQCRNAVDFNSRRAEAQALADACGAKVATNSWIIDSIAASKLQPQTAASVAS